MSRYYLVASYYDSNSKSYNNEIVIKELNGVKLNSLIKIDKFTSKNGIIDIFNMLEKELGIKEVNQLSIRYEKSKDDRPYYYRIIKENKLFNECVSSVVEKKVNILNKIRKTNFIRSNNELFMIEVEKLLKILENKDIDMFNEIYSNTDSNKSDFYFLVERYLNGSFDNEYDKAKELELILLEFSRYKTFRGWFICQEKRLDNIKYNTSGIKNSIKKNNVSIMSIEDNIKQYEKDFEEKNSMSVDFYNTVMYNQEHEEFLDEDEYNRMMNGESRSLRRK